VTDADRAPAGVEHELRVAAAGQTRRGRIAALIGIPFVLVTLAGELPGDVLVLWAAIAAVEAVAYFLWSYPLATAMSASGVLDPRWSRRAPIHAVGFGLVWGCLPLLTAARGGDDGIWLALLVSLSVLSVYVVSTASSRLLFVVGATPIVVQFAAATFVSDRTPARLGALVLVYAAIVLGLHAALRHHLVAATRSRHAAERLAARLNDFVTERDPVSQLWNRRSFITKLETLLADRDVAQVHVEVGNIRRLAAVNELYGDEFGDELIAHVGVRLRAVEASGGIAARLGGDEFAIATTNAVVTLRGLVSGVFECCGNTVAVDMVTASTTAGTAGRRGAEEVVADALFALRAGRRSPTTSVGERSLDDSRARRELVRELRTGMSEAGVHACFQPIVDARTRHVVAWEALARWSHPDLGVVTPARLLPLCDMAGLNLALLETVTRDAARFLAALEVAGASDHVVHVNLDAADLHERSMPDVVLGALQDERVGAGRLVLELTEREILRVDHEARSTLGRLDAAGVRLAVDDFGTGYSSLSHLLDFPADHIKIDRRFVAGLPHDTDALALVRGVVSMAHGLGLTSVAEGVETESAALTVQSLGCDRIQGYLVAPALRAGDAVTWWLTRSGHGVPAGRVTASG
jgi:predicted signal transduction protein with EAL and GGDEF domain